MQNSYETSTLQSCEIELLTPNARHAFAQCEILSELELLTIDLRSSFAINDMIAQKDLNRIRHSFNSVIERLNDLINITNSDMKGGLLCAY